MAAICGYSGAQAEGFLIPSEWNEYEINPVRMDEAVGACVASLYLSVAAPLPCAMTPVQACKLEDPQWGGTRTGNLICLGAAIISWNRVLDESLTHLRKEFSHQDAVEADSPSTRELRMPALAKVQDAWEAYLIAECGLIAAKYRLGTFADVFTSQCHIEMITARIVSLVRYSEQP